MLLKRIFIIFLSLYLAQITRGQEIPWEQLLTGNFMKIGYRKDLIRDNSNIIHGDVIGAFYDSAGIHKCCGYITYDSSLIHDYFYAREKTDTTPGFTLGDTVFFKVYRPSENHIYENVSHTSYDTIYKIYPGDKFFGILSLYIHYDFNIIEQDTISVCKNEQLTINAYKSDKAKYIWPDNSGEDYYTFLAKESEYITVEFYDSLSKDYFIDSVWIKVLDYSYYVDTTQYCDRIELSYSEKDWLYIWNTGNKEPVESIEEPGLYWVQGITNNNCIINDTFNITFEPYNIEDISIIVIDATSANNSKIIIDTTSIKGGSGNYQIEITNTLTGVKFNSDYEFNDIPTGEYTLEIFDGKCTEHYSQLITVKEYLNCEKPKLTPDGDGFDDTYIIEEPGKAIVYDKNIQKITEFSTPAEWDCTDSNGNILPMGSYIIVINNKKRVLITIIL